MAGAVAGLIGALTRWLPIVLLAPIFVGGLFGVGMGVPAIAQTFATLIQILPMLLFLPIMTSIIQTFTELTRTVTETVKSGEKK